MFKVAIVGKPNVGKTTIFNKLIGKKIAITHNSPGITRDRKDFDIDIDGVKVRIMDTAGVEDSRTANEIEKKMFEQSYYAIDEADLCFLVIDGKNGITEQDKMFARFLKKKKADKVVLLVNKTEHIDHTDLERDFYSLGYSYFVLVAAENNVGIAEIKNIILEFYDQYKETYGEADIVSDDGVRPIQIAVVGRPNAGKSTFINKLIKSERLIATDIPGTTRDAISIEFDHKGTKIKFVDTAGIRKKMNISDEIEEMSIAESFRAIDFAHIVILMMDATCPFEHQDLSIASRVVREGRIFLPCLNKWDKIGAKDRKNLIEQVQKWLERHSGLTYKGGFFTLSALHDKDLDKIIDDCVALYQKWKSKISTSKLNDWMAKIRAEERIAPVVKGKKVKLKFIAQVQSGPPLFMISSNFDDIPDSYLSFIRNNLIEHFGLHGIPVRFVFRKAKNPFSS